MPNLAAVFIRPSSVCQAVCSRWGPYKNSPGGGQSLLHLTDGVMEDREVE